MGLEVTGFLSALNALEQLHDLTEVFGDTLEQIGFEILKEAKKRTPVDTGFLRSSGKVERRGEVVVIRFEAEYALAVHERTDVSHSVGEAKFLENAFELVVEKEKASEILVDRLKSELPGG